MFRPNTSTFTIIDDVFPNLEDVSMTNYGKMPNYNSNRIIPSYVEQVPPNIAQQYINKLENEYPNNNSVNTPYGNVLLPRQTSFQYNSMQQNAPIQQYGQFTVQPPFAGAIPMLKNAINADTSIPMYQSGYFNPYPYQVQPYVNSYLGGNNYATAGVHMPQMYDLQNYSQPKSNNVKEYFRFRGDESEKNKETVTNCKDISNHLAMCEYCQKLFKPNYTIFYIIILILVLMFITIIYLIQRKDLD
jgi:hypothetical protein